MKAHNCRVGKTYRAPSTSSARQHNHVRPMASSFNRAGAGDKGTLHGWNPRIISKTAQAHQRDRIQRRTNDLYLNNPLSASAIETSVVNTIGSGLKPRPLPDFKALGKIGIDETMAREIAEQADREYKNFNRGLDTETTASDRRQAAH